MFAILFSLGLILLYFGIGQARRQKKLLLVQQIKYVFFAFASGTTGLIDYIIKYKIEIYPWGYISALFFISLIAYAIIKHHLMDITLVWRQILIFAGYFVTACSISALVVFFGHRYPFPLGVIMTILLLVAPFIYHFLQRFSEPIVDKVLLGGKSVVFSAIWAYDTKDAGLT